jgi:integrase/recombinase XerD
MSKRGQASSKPARRMDAGNLRMLVDQFAKHLTTLAHTRLTVAGYADAARHFGQWLKRVRVDIAGVDDHVIDRFARHRCRCPGNRRHDHLSAKYVNRARRFVCFLAEHGIAAPQTAIASGGCDQVEEFQQWLRRHRGISPLTVDRHGRMVMRLLPALGHDPKRYDAGVVRRVILAEAKCSSPTYVKTMATALRGYLRFLAASDLGPPGLDHAVPTVPQWRLSALPRYIGAADIERLIASCDLSTSHGIRDRAILLLLARLGLRAGDILAMCLDDIAWPEATLRVRGKGRREIRLPLPQDAGDAVLDYLERVRPRVTYDRVFLRSSAPYRPFSGPSVISSIVGLALKRAGIDDAPSKGANLLRHSAATAMLRGGATLDLVGAVLRHRSPNTTAHYAKVDVVMLQQIAQPWPGDA